MKLDVEGTNIAQRPRLGGGIIKTITEISELRPPLLETGKPDPTLFLRAAKALQLSPDRCVVVEDAPAGVEAAHKAGMSCIAVATTRSRDVLAEVTSLTLLFDDLTQVKEESSSNLINIDL